MRTIVWDVDDVLNNLNGLWFARWREEHPETKLTYDELSSNPPHEILGISREVYLESLDKIRASISGHEDLTPQPEIVAWLGQHGHRYRHLALTARPPHTAAAAGAWVLGHFGQWIRTVAFVPPRKPPEWPDYDPSKAAYLDWLDLDCVMVDDTEKTIMEVKDRGRPAILFPQPWNSRPHSVTEVLAQLAQF
jgi:phosphoglycolate phosphatase-like HAD superfamily hydrolase